MPFVKFPAQQHVGDVYVNSDLVSCVTSSPGSLTVPEGSAIHFGGGGQALVKELPDMVVSDLEDADCACCDCVRDGCDCLHTGSDFGPDTRFELTPFAEEMLKQPGKLTPISQSPEKLRAALDEAQSDAKIADERAEWFKRLAAERLAKLSQAQSEATRQIEDYRALGMSIISQKDAEIKQKNGQIAENERAMKVQATEIRRLNAENNHLHGKAQEWEALSTYHLRHSIEAGNRDANKIRSLEKELAEWRSGMKSPWGTHGNQNEYGYNVYVGKTGDDKMIF